jgi:hypothetical protein
MNDLRPAAAAAPKRLVRILPAAAPHWVGDGFPVRSLFDYGTGASDRSPFLLLDYAAPHVFPPSARRLGVGEHPHRGFETVTIVFAGQVEHRDSAGGGGTIGPGDVQWMTAGAGLVHEEFHGRDFARSGGPFEMAQLWVNLPARHKLVAPRYQGIVAAAMPTLALGADGDAGTGTARVIAGEFGGVRGPAQTFSPVLVLEVRIERGTVFVPLPDGFTTLLMTRTVAVHADGADEVPPARVAEFTRGGHGVRLAAAAPASVLVLAGAPLHEPVVAHGPFVMNTAAEIRQAIADYQSGRMGSLGG